MRRELYKVIELPAKAAADRAKDGPPVGGLVEVVNNVLRMHKMLVMAK